MRTVLNVAMSIAGISILLSSGREANACSMAFPQFEVASDFLVSVTNNGMPLQGIEVEVSREIDTPKFHFEVAFWDRTDEQGQVHVRGLSAGRYLIITRHARIEGMEAAELQVSTSPDVLFKLELHWPARQIFTLHQIAGVLAVDQDLHNPFTRSAPGAGASVLLLHAKSGQQIGATVANDHGRFEFSSTLEPGLYIMHISEQGLETREHELLQGNIFIEVDPKSANSELPKMNLTMTTCGLSAFTARDQLVTF